MYSCHLFLISSGSIRSLLLLSLIVTILARNVPLISPIFLKQFHLSHSCFLYIAALLIEEGFLSLLAILWNSAFSWVYLSLSHLFFTCLFPQLFVKPLSQISFIPNIIKKFEIKQHNLYKLLWCTYTHKKSLGLEVKIPGSSCYFSN